MTEDSKPRRNGARPRRTGSTHIAELRARTGLTQPEIAAMTGLRQSKISDIERGSADAANITLSSAAKLATALGVHAEELLDPGLRDEIARTARENAPEGHHRTDPDDGQRITSNR